MIKLLLAGKGIHCYPSVRISFAAIDAIEEIVLYSGSPSKPVAEGALQVLPDRIGPTKIYMKSGVTFLVSETPVEICQQEIKRYQKSPLARYASLRARE